MNRMPIRLFIASALLTLTWSTAFAQVVTRIDDPPDPAPAGTLRWAIEQRNGCTGGCTPITFNIPAASCASFECRIGITRPLPALMGTPGYVIDGSSQQSFNSLFVVIDGTAVTGDGLVANTGNVSLSQFGIGGFTGAGVRISGLGSGASIQQLQIGIDQAQTPLPNGIGIQIDSGVLGATISSLVWNSAGDGVQVGTSNADVISGVRIFGMSLKDNGGLGIDLGNDGPNGNDPLDVDLGPNGLQNSPVLTSATWISGNQLRVQGTLSVEWPFASYDVEIYGTDASDPEGHTSLFFQTYQSDGAGNVAFDETLFVSGGFDAITATATEADPYVVQKETSEFSNALPLQVECTVTNTNDSGAGSLRDAIQQANAGVCPSIGFDIPGAGPTFVIQPLTPLDSITFSGLVIDGRTQTTNNGDTNPSGPEIVLDGSLLTAGHGLHIDSSGTFVDQVEFLGLVIQNFPGDGIRVDGGAFGTFGTTISDSYIGTDATGTSDAGNGGHGVGLFGSVGATLIGGDPFAGTRGNVISGNGGYGVYAGLSSGNNDVVGNVIGADKSGTSAIPNDLGGIYLDTVFNNVGFSFSRGKTAAASFAGQFTERQLAERPAIREALELRAARIDRATAPPTPSTEGPVAAAAVAPSALPDPSGNIIAFNGGHGITLDAGASNNFIVLNWIHSNGVNGTGDGVHLTPTAGNRNTIEENSIEINADLGINIVPAPTSSATEDPNGVLINDGLESPGPNDELDYPTILDAVYDGSVTTITYTFASASGAYSSYDFLFYTSPVPDPSGFGEGETFLIRETQTYGVVDPDGTQQHVAVVNGDLRDLWITGTTTNPGSSTSEFSNAVLVRAVDFGITKSGPATALIGQTITYVLTVTNFGPASAGTVTVSDTFPGPIVGAPAVSTTAGTSWVCTPAGNALTCTAATMLDADVTTITVDVTAPFTPGAIQNSATVSATPDVDPSNDTSNVVTTTLQSAELSITKTDAPDPVRAGQNLTYTITVMNSGTIGATGVVVTDFLPASVNLVSAGNSAWSCSPSGSTVTCNFTGGSFTGTSSFPIIVTPTAVGTISNTADVSSATPESNPNDNTATATTTVDPPGADLKLDKAGPATADPGEVISYLLIVTNQGPGDAASVSVTDTIPSGMTYLGTTSAGWSCVESPPGTVVCTLSAVPLASGATASVTLDVRGPSTAATRTNTATVTSTSFDPATANNSDSVTTRFEDPCPGERPTLVAPAANASNVVSPVTFRWLAVSDASGYQVWLEPAVGADILLVEVPGSAPAGSEMSVEASVPDGRNIWWVRARSADRTCPDRDSPPRLFFSSQSCPNGVPEVLDPEQGPNGDVTLRWTRVDEAVRYHVFLGTNGGELIGAGSVEQVEPGVVPSFMTNVPAGAEIRVVIEAEFEAGCPRTRSPEGGFDAPCYAPILSIPGEVTSEKSYQVRATIVSVGRQYLFEESTSPAFDSDLVVKTGEVDPSGDFIFAIFEHEVTEPTPFYYRTRVDQSGCAFSEFGRIVIIPPSNDSILQLGLEEVLVKQIVILSPPESDGAAFTYLVVDDREWILDVTPSSGTIGPDEILVLTVTIDPLGLPVGTTIGTIEAEFTPIETSGKRAQSNHTIRTSTPVSVTLVTPVTNKGKSGPIAESLIIPAVAHANGIDSEWVSDIRLLNLGTTEQTYALNFTVSNVDGTQEGKTAEIDLNPGENTALNDLVRQWYGLGSLPDESTTGVLEIRPIPRGVLANDQTPVTKSLVSLASSRTYNKTAQGTLGQFIPGVPFAAFVGKTAPEAAAKSILSLQQLAQNDAYRTNFGLVEASGKAVDLAVRFYDADGNELLLLPMSLRPGEHMQINQILAQNGITDLDFGRAEVEVLEGEGRITAYASVVDNLSNDPLLVQAVNLAEIGSDRYVAPGLAHFETGQASWRSDMQLFNADLVPVQATLSFYRQRESTPAATTQITLEPGTITSLGNVIATVFGEANTGGSVHVTTATSSKLVVTARTYDQTEAGTFGQFIPAVTEAQAFGLGDRPMQVLQMEQSPNVRTNLGIVEITGQPVQIELTAHIAESRVTPRVQMTLQANEFRQLDRVLQSLNVGTTYNARVALRVIGGQGKIVAYGSAVDNKTQDPTFVPGQ